MQWTKIEEINQLTPQAPRLGNWLKTERAQVPGGWLVRTFLMQREAAQVPGGAIEAEFSSGVALTFVPDPSWSWRP